MKLIPVFILIFLLFSCESGPVEPTIRIDSKEEAFKQEQRLKKRFERIHAKRREITKKEVKVQEKRRKFLLDTTELENTDVQKIEYYLEKAQEAQKFLKMEVAIRYANKVLDIDPKNIDAKRIIRSYRKMLSIQARYTPSANMDRRNKKLAKNAKANIETQKGKNMYENFKAEVNRKAAKGFKFEDAFKKQKRR
jgi:hypothetical protein